jgi:hypothetical protein
MCKKEKRYGKVLLLFFVKPTLKLFSTTMISNFAIKLIKRKGGVPTLTMANP